MESLQKDLASEINECLINSSNIYLVVTNNSGDFLFANDHYKNTFLSSPGNLKEYSFSNILHSLDVDEMKRGMLACTSNGQSKPHQIINRNRVKDTNRYKSIKWECSCLKNKTNVLLMHIGYDLVAVENQSDYTNQTNKTLNDLIDDLQIGVVIQDVDSSILLSNAKAEELLGLNKSELYGRTVHNENWKIVRPDGEVFPPEELPVSRAIQTKRYIQDVIMGVFNPKLDQYFWFQVDANPDLDENDNVERVVTTFIDITKQKEEEEQLRLLESVITSTKDAVLITEAEPIDSPGPKIVYANQAFYDITGYSKEDIIGNNPRILQGKNTDRKELDRLRKALENWETCEVQLINYKKNGEEFWVNFRVVPVANKEGIFTHWISVQQNITARVRQEESLKNALKEKTTLLAEIHHRVKNNLAIVSGLLELQSMELEAASALPLKRSINRIQSIAMVHELMYQTEQLSSINIKSYLDELIPAIYQTMRLKEDVTFNIDLEDYEININQAIPLGLLINELLTNSFKYAFLKTFDGQIDISMKIERDTLKFTYADNGSGFRKGKNFNNSSSLGLSLIKAQLEQLHADYEVITKGHFELSFAFKISKRGPHSNI